MSTYKEVLAFWFDEIDASQRWKKDDAFDAMLSERFGALHAQAKQCELVSWRDSAEGALAEVIVLDQFSRNMFRGSPHAFECDSLALALSQYAITQGYDQKLEASQRSFLYMPYMHSESPVIHEDAVRIFTDLGNKSTLEYELKHKAIIDRFGRYPHRNEILQRDSTPEEIEFLQQPGSGF